MIAICDFMRDRHVKSPNLFSPSFLSFPPPSPFQSPNSIPITHQIFRVLWFEVRNSYLQPSLDLYSFSFCRFFGDLLRLARVSEMDSGDQKPASSAAGGGFFSAIASSVRNWGSAMQKSVNGYGGAADLSFFFLVSLSNRILG